MKRFMAVARDTYRAPMWVVWVFVAVLVTAGILRATSWVVVALWCLVAVAWVIEGFLRSRKYCPDGHRHVWKQAKEEK